MLNKYVLFLFVFGNLPLTKNFVGSFEVHFKSNGTRSYSRYNLSNNDIFRDSKQFFLFSTDCSVNQLLNGYLESCTCKYGFFLSANSVPSNLLNGTCDGHKI